MSYREFGMKSPSHTGHMDCPRGLVPHLGPCELDHARPQEMQSGVTRRRSSFSGQLLLPTYSDHLYSMDGGQTQRPLPLSPLIAPIASALCLDIKLQLFQLQRRVTQKLESVTCLFQDLKSFLSSSTSAFHHGCHRRGSGPCQWHRLQSHCRSMVS